MYYFVSQFSNLVNRVLQTGVHTLRKRFWKGEYLFWKTFKVYTYTIKLLSIYSELSFQHWLFRDLQGGKFMSHMIIDSVLAQICFETQTLKLWNSDTSAENVAPTPCSWRRSLKLLVALCWRIVQSHVPLTGQCRIDSAWLMTVVENNEGLKG